MSLNKQRCKIAIDALTEINERHIACKDHLSLRLFNWISTVICLHPDEEDFLIHAKDIADFAEKQLKELHEKILVNPLQELSKHLLEPMLANGWVWDKGMLQEYEVVHKIVHPDQPVISPYHNCEEGGSLLLEAGEVHAFAREIFAWSAEHMVSLTGAGGHQNREITQPVGQPFSTQCLQPLNFNCSQRLVFLAAQLRLKQYASAAKKAHTRRTQECSQMKIELALVMALKREEEQRKQQQQDLAQAREAQAAHQQRTDQERENLRHLHEDVAAAQQEQINKLEQEFRELAAKTAALEALARQQEARIQALHYQYQQRIRQMQEQQNRGRNSCSIL